MFTDEGSRDKYMGIHTYTLINTHAYIHGPRVWRWRQIHRRIYIYTYKHTYIHTYIHTYMHAYTDQASGDGDKYMGIHTCTLIHIHTYMHTQTKHLEMETNTSAKNSLMAAG